MHFGLYEHVWSRIKARDVAVQYDACVGVMNSHFQDDGKAPSIVIVCTNGGFERVHANKPSRRLASGGVASDERLQRELIAMAHEYGHVVSKQGRTPLDEWKKYRAAEDKRRRGEPISAGETRRILDEETLAWEISRELLTEIGFEDWPAFDQQREGSLATYR